MRTAIIVGAGHRSLVYAQYALEDSRFVIRHIDPRPGHEYSEEIVDLSVTGDKTGAFGGHGGGDLRLVGDFVRLLHGDEPSFKSTTIEDSVSGHLMGFCADRSMEEGRIVKLNWAPRSPTTSSTS